MSMFKRVLPAAIALTLSAAVSAEVFRVDQIGFQGLQRVSQASANSTVTLLAGNIDQSAISAAVRALYQSGYYDQVTANLVDGVLTFEVIERPQIDSIEIDGTDSVPEAALTSALSAEGIRGGEILNRAKIEVINGELERQYAQVGLYNANVDIQTQPLPNNRVALTIQVEEGDKSEVASINIAGNRVFDDNNLLDQFVLKPRNDRDFYDILFSNHDYSGVVKNGDLQRLESYYFDRGYIDFSIDSEQASLSRDRRYMALNLNVSEGEQYTVNSAQIVLPDDIEIAPVTLLQKGDIFARSSVIAAQQAILDQLNERGYFFARVDIVPNVNRDDLTVDLVYQVTLGELTYVRKIEFVGNDLTNDITLRRELLQLEQSLAVVGDIRGGTSRLMRLGFLRNATVDTQVVPGTNNQIDVIYTVEEEKTGSISGSLQFSPGRGLTLGADYAQKNLMGTGHEAAFKLNFSTTNDNGKIVFAQRTATISYDVPYVTEGGVSLGADLYVEEINDAIYKSTSRYTTNDYGIRVRTGYPTSLNTRLTWSAGFERKDLIVPKSTVIEDGKVVVQDGISDEVTAYINQFDVNYNTFTLGATLSYYTLEGAFLISRGSSHRLSLNWAVPGSTSSWYKIAYQGEKYIPLFNRKYWALRLHGDFGFGLAASDSQMPFYELYNSGGARSVRGYALGSLAPTDSEGDIFGGNLKTEAGMELLMPMPFLENKDAWRTALFLDAGNTFTTSCGKTSESCTEGFKFDEIKLSAGIDLTWMTPIAPISFVFGYPILDNYTSGQKDSGFSFSLGYSY